MSAPPKRKRGSNWDEGSEKILIELYSEYFNQLETMSTKKPIYQKIADKLEDKTDGMVTKTWNQVQKKIKALKAKYKSENPNPTGGERSKWVHYDLMHKILHEKPAFNSEVAETSEIGFDSEIGEIVDSPIDCASNHEDVSEAERTIPEKRTPSQRTRTAQARANTELVEIAKETLTFLKEESTKRDEVRKEITATNVALLEQLNRLVNSSEKIAEAVSQSFMRD